ncbi:MAG: hypothetical protein R3F19_26250 [Verrucomicrobiales bacterium]
MLATKTGKNYSENVKDKLSIGSGVTGWMQSDHQAAPLPGRGDALKEKGCASVLTLRALNRTGGR